MASEFYTELIKRIEINDIALGDVKLKKDRTIDEVIFKGAIAEVEFSPAMPVVVGNQLWAKGSFKVEGFVRDPEEGIRVRCFSLEFDIVAEYSIFEADEDAPLDFDGREMELKIFAENNLPINVWPYAREFVSSMTVRMGFPALIIGAYKSIPKG